MPNPSWMDRLSAMTARSKKSFLSSRLPRWKLSIVDIYWSDCTWDTVRRTIVAHPLDDFIVWYRESKEEPWHKVVSAHIGSNCPCGRPWIDAQGNIFAFRGKFRELQSSYEDMLEWLNDPMRCKFCFYRDQHKNDDWVPKSVLKELGLNPN